MKTNFKKLALAAATTAAVAGSMNASAVIQGVPGEAVLVPLVYFAIDASLGQVDTIFRITAPKSIGYDVVSQFTAPNTVSSAPQASNENVTQAGLVGGLGNPTSAVHWFFMSNRSVHNQNGSIPVTADDVATFTASDALGGFGSTWDGTPGYFIFTTETASLGTADADFAFFVDAYLSVPGGAQGTDANTPAIVPLPSLPMADSLDTAAAPTTANNVVENVTYVGNNPVASPIVSGIRTAIGSTAYNLRVYDVVLANRNDNDLGTLIVSWNDRNLGSALNSGGSLAGADEFDMSETKCSTSFSLPNQLNLVWVPSFVGGTAWGLANTSAVAPAGTSLLSDGMQNTLCTNFGSNRTTTGANGAGGGFLKLFHQNPTGATEAATYAFSIPFESLGGAANAYDVYSTSWQSHDRGNFANR